MNRVPQFVQRAAKVGPPYGFWLRVWDVVNVVAVVVVVRGLSTGRLVQIWAACTTKTPHITSIVFRR